MVGNVRIGFWDAKEREYALSIEEAEDRRCVLEETSLRQN